MPKPERIYCSVHGKNQRRDKCQRCQETFMYRQACEDWENHIAEIQDFMESQKDLPEGISKLVDEHFWELF